MIAVERASGLLHRAVAETALGRFAMAASESGLCSLVLLGNRVDSQHGDPAHPHVAAARAALESYCAGDPAPYRGALDLRGTEFQLQVWRRLLAIPFGAQVTYGEIARDLGVPEDARAVGAAVAANPIAILVPCHRVVGAGGTLRGYAWGLDLKRSLLAHETGHVSPLRSARSRKGF